MTPSRLSCDFDVSVGVIGQFFARRRSVQSHRFERHALLYHGCQVVTQLSRFVYVQQVDVKSTVARVLDSDSWQSFVFYDSHIHMLSGESPIVELIALHFA